MSTPGHINVHGDPDPGGSDRMADSVDGAVAAADARWRELESDTFGAGSVIGDLMTLPPVPGADSKHAGGDDRGYPS
jgi:hypothetical protein